MFLFIYLVGYGSPPGSSFLPIGNRLSPAGSNPSPGARSAGHLVRSSVSPASSSLSSHLEPVGYGLGTCKYLAEYSLIYYSDLKLVLIIVLAVNVWFVEINCCYNVLCSSLNMVVKFYFISMCWIQMTKKLSSLMLSKIVRYKVTYVKDKITS